MRSLQTITLFATILGIVACGGGDDASTTDAGGDDATTTMVDAGCSTLGLADEPDDQGSDDNCDGVDGVAASDIYVNPASGADTNDGSPATPLRTLPAALTRVAIKSPRVFLAKGTYNIESLNVSADVQIIGGYDATFRGSPHRENTTLHASATGLLVDVSSAHVSFSHLTIEGQNASDPSQISAYGLRIRSGDVAIDDVVVSSGDALGGTAGQAGANALPGNDPSYSTFSGTLFLGTPIMCDGIQQPAFTAGTGACPATNGAAGADGTDGANAVSFLQIGGGFLDTPAKGEWGRLGAPGTGAASCKPVEFSYYYYNGGNGGCPGEPGEGGTSGGSSVSVLAFGGSFAASRSVLHTGLGGTGGDGGAGGRGTNGITANGFTGGRGGDGGHGGGGVGGSTIGVLSLSSVPVEIDSLTTYDLGPPGRGGIGRAGALAPSGKSAPISKPTIECNGYGEACSVNEDCCSSNWCVSGTCLH